MNCGLLGQTLRHSYSPQIHNSLGDYSYSLFEVEPAGLEDFLKNGNFDGLNITIPYKKAVVPYCNKLSSIAKKLNSVNTLVRQSDGSLLGHNTDYFGFLSTVQKTGLSVSGKKVLVLGSGGASVTAVAVLQELNADVITISRSGKNNYTNLHLHADASLIVNATPVGMYPDTSASPLSLETFPHLEGVIDLIYNPARTALLQQAERRGIVAENGLYMLVAQAKESAEWFTGQKISNAKIKEIYKQLSNQMENIVLIGMPGSGKSTIGMLLAQIANKEFIDADAYLEKKFAETIPNIFAKYGEEHFRNLETQVIADLAKRSGLVIATGGGCVTRPENYSLLHQNGKIIWIKRDISVLATDGRPLSSSGNLQAMYEKRQPLYEKFSDFSVCNDDFAEETAQNILSHLHKEEI